MGESVLFAAGKELWSTLGFVAGAGSLGSLLTIWLSRRKHTIEAARAEIDTDNAVIAQLEKENGRLAKRVHDLEQHAAIVHRAVWERDQAVAQAQASAMQGEIYRANAERYRLDVERLSREAELLYAEMRRTDDLKMRASERSGEAVARASNKGKGERT